MKTLKFRYWHHDHWHHYGWNIDGHLSFSGIGNCNHGESLGMDEIRKRSCQYVGMKDQNGTEVFEADIILTAQGTDGERVGLVSYWGTCFIVSKGYSIVEKTNLCDVSVQ